MQHSLHIFLGDELSTVAEAVNVHLTQHCDSEGRKFSHVATLCSEDNIHSVRVLDKPSKKTAIANDTEGIAYFRNLHPSIVVAEGTIDVSSYLYVCLYIQAYNNLIKEEANKVIDWINKSQKHFIIDVFGIADDLAELFCLSEIEKNNLVYSAQEFRINVINISEEARKLVKHDSIRHFILIQGCNLTGLGLDLDKSTLIRIIGEYARISTTNFNDLYPATSINKPELIGIGISAYWFNPKFFQNYIYSRCFVNIMKREKVDQHKMAQPNQLLKIAKEYIDKYSKFLKDTEVSSENTAIATDEFNGKLDDAVDDIINIINRTNLSLPEKRALFAMLLGEDDELFDDSVLLKYLPTIDDCITDAANLFISENNKMVEEDGTSILTYPKHDGKVYLPLEELRKNRTAIRQSQSFIRKSKKRLEEIKQEIKVTEESKKRLTERGFVYGETIYKLQHEVVETPLDETFQPKDNAKTSVDLRNGFSDIRNQKDLGACTAFSMASIFEYIINQNKPSEKSSLSPRFLYFNVCDKNIDGTPIDKGSSFYNNIKSLGESGICEESLCGYDEDFNLSPSDEANNDAKTRLVTQAMNVEVSHKALTSALSEGYPIGISLKIFDSFGKGHKGFVFRPTEIELNSTDFGYHAMVICGYSEKEKVYIVRNSWGLGFGVNGYCYVPFSYIEDNALCRQACIVTGVSCGKAENLEIQETEDFNLSDKDIEYAVLRIKIEEEKVNLEKLKKEYDENYKNYMLLLADLSNKGKRDKIMNHALNNISNETTSSEEIEITKETSTNKMYYFGACFMLVILSFICLFTSSDKDIKTIATISAIILGALALYFFLGYPSKKRTKETIIKESTKPNQKYISLEQTFLFAGRIIDKFQELRNKITNKHKLLISYIRNLEIWLYDEQENLSNYDEGIRKPFYSLFSDNQVDVFIENHSAEYINDIWLNKRLEDYGLTEDKIYEYKKKLRNDIENKVSLVTSSFSMSKFLLNMDNYPYLLEIDHQTLFSTIMNMSKPFVQTTAGVPSKLPYHILLCNVNTSSEEWDYLIQDQYVIPPNQAHDNDTTKITYIQLQELNLDESLYSSST